MQLYEKNFFDTASIFNTMRQWAQRSVCAYLGVFSPTERTERTERFCRRLRLNFCYFCSFRGKLKSRSEDVAALVAVVGAVGGSAFLTSSSGGGLAAAVLVGVIVFVIVFVAVGFFGFAYPFP